MIETMGQYLQALALGRLDPLDDAQRHFVDVANGRASSVNDIERAWLEFAHDDPRPEPLSETGPPPRLDDRSK